MERLKKNKSRYNLHYRIRKDGIRLNTKEKTIYHRQHEPIPESKGLKGLIEEFGYSLQLTF